MTLINLLKNAVLWDSFPGVLVLDLGCGDWDLCFCQSPRVMLTDSDVWDPMILMTWLTGLSYSGWVFMFMSIFIDYDYMLQVNSKLDPLVSSYPACGRCTFIIKNI